MATADIKEADDEIDEHTKPPFLRRVRIRGYKSIAFCDVTLEPLTILVGRNGAGKSNFLDALAFLRDLILTGPVGAVHSHGGRRGALSRTSNNDQVSFEIEIGYADTFSGIECSANYQITVSMPPASMPVILLESIRKHGGTNGAETGFDRRRERIRWIGLGGFPDTCPPYRSAFDYCRDFFPEIYLGMTFSGFYNFSPEAIRILQRPTPGSPLDKNGANLASVITGIREKDTRSADRIKLYMSAIVEDVEDVKPVEYGEYQTIRFRMRPGDGNRPREFDAASISDGTLRVLAALVAAAQKQLPTAPGIIGIEEPETALHPAAVHVLVDALREATQHTQIILTTHSADLLDDRHIHPNQVLVVRNRNGQTVIAPIGPAGKEIVQKELYSLAELQRMDHLDPDEENIAAQAKESNGKQEK